VSDEEASAVKILIVDDSSAMRMIVRRALRQAGYGDHDIKEADNGKRALEQIGQERPDVILSDWNMPEMSGIELLRSVRAMAQPIPLGLVTSQSSPQAEQEARDAGAAFILTKPFTPEAFKAALEPVLA
jgi:two-component system chemotaxis response regulator CheY